MYLHLLNEGFVELTQNWICNVRQMPRVLDRTLFVCTDHASFQALSLFAAANGIALHLHLQEFRSPPALRYGQLSYYNFILFRASLLEALLSGHVGGASSPPPPPPLSLSSSEAEEEKVSRGAAEIGDVSQGATSPSAFAARASAADTTGTTTGTTATTTTTSSSSTEGGGSIGGSEGGVSVFLVEADAAWFGDPSGYFLGPEVDPSADIVFAHNDFIARARGINGGFIWFKSRPLSVEVLQKLYTEFSRR